MIEKKLKLFINGLLLNPVVLIKSSEIILYNMVEPGLMDESKIMRPTFSTLTWRNVIVENQDIFWIWATTISTYVILEVVIV